MRESCFSVLWAASDSKEDAFCGLIQACRRRVTCLRAQHIGYRAVLEQPPAHLVPALLRLLSSPSSGSLPRPSKNSPLESTFSMHLLLRVKLGIADASAGQAWCKGEALVPACCPSDVQQLGIRPVVVQAVWRSWSQEKGCASS